MANLSPARGIRAVTMKELCAAVQNIAAAYIELLPAVKNIAAAIGNLLPAIAKRADRTAIATDITGLAGEVLIDFKAK